MTDITGDNSTALQDKITMVSELSLISTNLNLEPAENEGEAAGSD